MGPKQVANPRYARNLPSPHACRPQGEPCLLTSAPNFCRSAESIRKRIVEELSRLGRAMSSAMPPQQHARAGSISSPAVSARQAMLGSCTDDPSLVATAAASRSRLAVVRALTKAADTLRGSPLTTWPFAVTSEQPRAPTSPPPENWKEEQMEAVLPCDLDEGNHRSEAAEPGMPAKHPIWDSFVSGLRAEIRALCGAHGWEIWCTPDTFGRWATDCTS